MAKSQLPVYPHGEEARPLRKRGTVFWEVSMSVLTRRAALASAGAATSAVLGRAQSANNRIRIGLIGAGGRGGNHIADLAGLKDLNVTIGAICDVWRVNREKSAAAVEKAFGARPRTTSDYRQLLDWKDIDAVVIATPDFSHPIILKAAVEAGKDAYVEKPFATTFAEAKAAYLAVKNSRRIVQVGTQRRSDGKFMAAARLMRAGAIGKVTRVEVAVAFQEPRWRRPDEDIQPADVDWKAFQMGRIERGFDPRLLREWQLFPETTNGIPGLWMSHFVDLVPWFLDAPYPAGAVSNGGVFFWKDGRKTSDVFYTLLDYPQDFVFLFGMSLTNAAGNRCVWYGARGILDCDRWVVSPEGSKMPDRVPAETRIVPEISDSHMHNFLECLRSRQAPRAGVEAGFSHAVAGIMAAQALEKGRRVRFDEAKLEIL
jgi:predicted dehydrogenase